ncbi:MAG: DUF721 domain-containing protein [Bacteroidales bacterium]|nr:DUF721 domain-containing protein [Bacteroidales bacterium]
MDNEYYAQAGKRMGSAQKMSEILLDIMNENNMGRQMLEHRAIDLWKVVTGPTVVRATRAIYIKNSVMFVELNSSVIRNELIYSKSKVMENINSAVGQDIIQDIVFR